MFGQNDKVTLTLINLRDIMGNVLPYSFKLPLEGDLPENVVAMDVFLYQEGINNGAKKVFSIYVGEKMTLKELVLKAKSFEVVVSENNELQPDSLLLVQNIMDRKVASAIINENDIVVENREQLIMVVEEISDKFNDINKSLSIVRNLSIKYNKK